MSSQTISSAILQADNLAKEYRMGFGIVHALRGVSLTIQKGESVAIMGRSGSGKSTLMHLLGCLDLPSSGRYLLNGQDVATLSDTELSLLRATQIGFVFQAFNLIPQYSVYENIEIPFLYQNSRPDNLKPKIEHSIERVGLAHRLHHNPSQLSGGEMQRVAIARALAIDPILILADEPTGNLDSESGETILQLFGELNDQGVTIIMVTHDAYVGKHCQRIIRMGDGKILEES